MTERYHECDYIFQYSGDTRLVSVFIHVAMGTPPRTLKVDAKLQFGVNNGILVFVWHDGSKLKPYQHRFIRGDTDENAYVSERFAEKQFGVSLVWAEGDYLRDFQFRQNFD